MPMLSCRPRGEAAKGVTRGRILPQDVGQSGTQGTRHPEPSEPFEELLDGETRLTENRRAPRHDGEPGHLELHDLL